MRKILDDDQSIGPLKRITSQFTFSAASEFFASNIRTNDKLELLGCLGDLGWYNIRFTLWAMNWELPVKVTGHMLAEHRRPGSPVGVPTDFSAELFYANGVSASFYCSYLAEIQQWANLGGTKGSLYVPDFVLPWYGAEVALRSPVPHTTISGCDSTWRNIYGVSRFASIATVQKTRRKQTCFAGLLSWHMQVNRTTAGTR